MRISPIIGALLAVLFSAQSANTQSLLKILVEYQVDEHRLTVPTLVQILPSSGTSSQVSFRFNLNGLRTFFNAFAAKQIHGKLRYRGANISAMGNDLRLEVLLNYKVGGLIGSTNGAVTAIMQLETTEDSISLRIRSVDIRISNDLVRAVADLSGIKTRIRKTLFDRLASVISKDDGRLNLPIVIKGIGLRITDARFESQANNLVAVVEGRIPQPIRIRAGD